RGLLVFEPLHIGSLGTFTPDIEGISTSTGGLVSLVIGHEFKPINLRLEGEAAFGSESIFSSVEDSPIWSFQSYTLNVIYDIPVKTFFTPYVGVGAGIAVFNFLDVVPAAQNFEGSGLFTFNARVGASFQISDTSDIFVQYVYTRVSSDPVITGNTFGVGFRIGIDF
ncbi:MAG: outer membrane protein, partial [Prochloraceae cyanobacterium]